jgi:hypothetical protein
MLSTSSNPMSICVHVPSVSKPREKGGRCTFCGLCSPVLPHPTRSGGPRGKPLQTLPRRTMGRQPRSMGGAWSLGPARARAVTIRHGPAGSLAPSFCLWPRCKNWPAQMHGSVQWPARASQSALAARAAHPSSGSQAHYLTIANVILDEPVGKVSVIWGQLRGQAQATWCVAAMQSSYLLYAGKT